MSNVMIVKSPLLVFKKGDDLAIVTFEKVTIAKSSHLFPQTLPQSQTQTQAKKTHHFAGHDMRLIALATFKYQGHPPVYMYPILTKRE